MTFSGPNYSRYCFRRCFSPYTARINLAATTRINSATTPYINLAATYYSPPYYGPVRYRAYYYGSPYYRAARLWSYYYLPYRAARS